VYNDPATTQRIVAAVESTLGKENVVQGIPIMASDDFAEYGRAGVPSVMLSLGALNTQDSQRPRRIMKSCRARIPRYLLPTRSPA
jgi:metal-dependent amidase/aminoacylase/carboxypeptidase family protein